MENSNNNIYLLLIALLKTFELMIKGPYWLQIAIINHLICLFWIHI